MADERTFDGGLRNAYAADGVSSRPAARNGDGMEQRIRSTVVVPNYNGIQYIEDCLRSLADEPAHIIVVDNGSEDGSRQLVRDRFPGVELVCLDKNYGFCRAVNEGIARSKTTYVILLNNDTKVKSGFVKALEKPLEGHPEVFSGSAQMRNMYQPELIDDAGDYYCALGWAFARGKDRPWRDYQRGRRIFAACGGAAIYRRKLFDEIGCMDEHHFAYLEDIDLGYRARLSGYVNLYIPEAVVYHAGSGASGSRYNEFKVSLTSRNSVYLVYKNMPAFQILLNLPLLLVGFAVKGLFFARKGLGRTYLKGLGRGIAICLLGTGRERRVRFSGDRLYNCFLIQLELWRNIWYRFAER